MTTPTALPLQTPAIDLWLEHALSQNVDHSSALTFRLAEEVPPFLSLIVRGGCAVQCLHCIFPHEGPKPSEHLVETTMLLHLLKQLPGNGHLIHEGRQLLPEQIPMLATITQAGYGVSLINNGQYATKSILSRFEQEGLLVDTLDISIDGTEGIHNKQRASTKAWMLAMRGIENAPKILKPDGKLTSLFTISALNAHAVKETAEVVLPLVDEWHLTTMSIRKGLGNLRADMRMLGNVLKSLQSLDTKGKEIFLRTYSLEDFVAILQILGHDTTKRALRNARVTYNAIVLDIGFPLYFYPKSLQVNETMVIDADAWWRLPFCIHHSLSELQKGATESGENISHFNVTNLHEGAEIDVISCYRQAANIWWHTLGESCLREERDALSEFL